MRSRGPREYTYGQFTDFARRFDQEELLTAVAERAVFLPGDASEKPLLDQAWASLPFD